MNRYSRPMWLCLAIFLAAGTILAAEQIDLEQLRIPYEKIVLDNGLTVIVHEDHTVPIVAVNVWYHVGSGKERRGRTGLAHLFEHFFFNGSENYPHGFREAMDDLGVNNRNGTTNVDRTNFFEDVPTSALERTLYLEADRMGFLLGNLSEEMLERERGVVQNEKRQGENQPYGRVFGRIVESIYPYSHPYSWSTIGEMADLDAVALGDLEIWYKTYYGPNNCVIALAGDITPQRARELMQKYFGSIPPSPPIRRYNDWVPLLEENLRDSMQDRVPQARIYRVYHLPGWKHAELRDMQLASSVLAGSRSARLDRKLVYEKELVTDVGAFVWEKEIASNLILVATVKPGIEPLEVESEMDAVIATYLQQGPTADELERARTRTLSGLIRGMERLGGFGGRSDILAENATFGDSPDAYLDHLAAMLEATPEQVRATSRKWLERNHYTLTVFPFPELQASEPGDLDRSVLPAIGEASDVAFPKVQRTELGNGMRVLLLERHSAPLVNMALAIDAGYAADPGGRAGTATLALQVLEEGGTESRDAFTLVDELDALGASISTNSSLDLSFVRLRALAMNLPDSLDIFADVVRHPAFPENMLQISKRQQLAAIDQEQAQPVATALRIVPRLVYGEGHAYANPLTGSGYVETVEGIERKDLVAWHDKWFLPNNSTLIVTGDITLAALKPQIERTFGSWKKGKRPTKNIGAVQASHKDRVYLVDKPDATQSVIVATHLSKPGGQPEELAMEVVMRLFGGMSTSRLNRNLRLDKHWSYGAFGILLDARGPRPFTVIAPVQTDKTKESMIELRAEIQGIAGQRPVEGEEFESIKRNMVLRLPGRFETLTALERAATDIVNFGFDPEYYYDYARNVRGLGEDVVNAAAADYIQPGQLTWVVVGDLAKIEPGIGELGYGELVRLSPEGLPLVRRASH